MVSFGERSFYHMDVKFALYNCLQQFFSCLLSLKQPSISYIGGRTLVTGTLKGKGSRGSSYRGQLGKFWSRTTKFSVKLSEFELPGFYCIFITKSTKWLNKISKGEKFTTNHSHKKLVVLFLYEKSFFLLQKEVRIWSSILRLIEILSLVHPLCWGMLSESQCRHRQEEGSFFFPSIHEQVG